MKWLVNGLMEETGCYPHKITVRTGGYDSDPTTETKICFCSGNHSNVMEVSRLSTGIESDSD